MIEKFSSKYHNLIKSNEHDDPYFKKNKNKNKNLKETKEVRKLHRNPKQTEIRKK